MEVTAAARQGGGIGRYVRELLKALARVDAVNRYQLFFASPRPIPYALPELPPSFAARHLPIHDIWLARIWHRLRAPLPVELITGPVDVYHAPDFSLPPVAAPSVLTVHDLSFAREPESAAPGLRGYLDAVVPRSVQRASHIIAVSQSTKRDLIDLYATAPDKITVVYEGIDPKFGPRPDPSVRRKYGIGPNPYILSVSTIQPRKNYRRLIRAVRGMPEDFRLVIAGERGWLYDDIFAEADKPGVRGRVIFAGFVPEADLPALYSEASLFAYPSLYEGFGLPLLEAMACGTPTVTSTLSSLPEVAGGASVLVDAHDVDAIHAGLLQALAQRDELVARGLARAAEFRWEDTARSVTELYGLVTGS